MFEKYGPVNVIRPIREWFMKNGSGVYVYHNKNGQLIDFFDWLGSQNDWIEVAIGFYNLIMHVF